MRPRTNTTRACHHKGLPPILPPSIPPFAISVGGVLCVALKRTLFQPCDQRRVALLMSGRQMALHFAQNDHRLLHARQVLLQVMRPGLIVKRQKIC